MLRLYSVLLVVLAAVSTGNCSKQVLLVSEEPLRVSDTACSHNALLGIYGTPESRYHVYRNGIHCVPDLVAKDNLLSGSTLIPIDEHTRVMYVQEAGVEEAMQAEALSFPEALKQLQERISSFNGITGSQAVQSVLRFPIFADVLFTTSTSALVAIPDPVLPVIDLLLPRFFVSIILPSSPSFVPVPKESVDRVKDWLASLLFNPDVARMINDLSISAMRRDIRYLSGEDETSPIISRHSFAKGALDAANWIKDQIELSGATCKFSPFLIGFAPNVICRYSSLVDTTGTIILSAHYDSRGSFGNIRAPGGNDDGSGVLSILGIARTIKNKGIRFTSNVELVLFAGEEQGLLGSRAYAKQLREADANVTLMIQSDMLGYHKPGEPPQLGLPAYIGTPEVAQLLANVSALYSPELSVGYSSVCCSDHQTFHEQGYPATQAFERAGPIADPMYHNSDDLSDRSGYDLEQVRSIAKVTFGALLHTAGFQISSYT